MNKKFSNYNIYVKHDDHNLIFNTRTLALLEFPDDVYHCVKNLDMKSISDTDKQILYEHGYIIKSDFDEMQFLLNEYSKNVNSDEVLYLSIMTTLDCNFRCSYCFEVRTNCYFAFDKCDRIIKLLESKARLKYLNID